MERAARRRSSAAFVYHTLDGGLVPAPLPPAQFAPQTPPFAPSTTSLHEWSYVDPKAEEEEEEDERDKVIDVLNRQVLAQAKELDSLRDRHERELGEAARQGQARVLELQAQLQLERTTNQQLVADLAKLTAAAAAAATASNNSSRKEQEENKLANTQLLRLQEHVAGLRERLVAQTARADTLQELVREAGYDELVVKVRLPNGKRASFVCNGLTGDAVLCAEAFASHHRLGVEATRVLVAFTLAEASQCTF